MREQLKSANERILTLTQVSQSNDPNFKEYASFLFYFYLKS